MASGNRGGPRRLLPGVEIRPANLADQELLRRYFEGLPSDDCYLRFLGQCAGDTYLKAWLTLADEGGAAYLVCRAGTDGEEVCIGEAGYAPRGDGTAEFALSVSPQARGGLGSALIAHLRESAAAAGVRALHADVLTSNGAMNHLLRGLGGIAIERNPRMTGVVIATTGGVPPWPELDSRPRVLVESSDGRWAGEHVLREAGFQVAVCPGPHGRPASEPCPVLSGEPCELVAGADLVVHDLSPEQPMNRRLNEALEQCAAPVPVVSRGVGDDRVAPEAVLRRADPVHRDAGDRIER